VQRGFRWSSAVGGEGESLRDDVGVQSHLAGDIMGPGAWSCVA
jgi:hypothetical protein